MSRTQQQFERWAKRNGLSVKPLRAVVFGFYYQDQTQTAIAWRAWQAATRAASRRRHTNELP